MQIYIIFDAVALIFINLSPVRNTGNRQYFDVAALYTSRRIAIRHYQKEIHVFKDWQLIYCIASMQAEEQQKYPFS
jgi:hypothetical protein